MTDSTEKLCKSIKITIIVTSLNGAHAHGCNLTLNFVNMHCTDALTPPSQVLTEIIKAKILKKKKTAKKGNKAITNVSTRCSSPPQGNDD